MAVMAVMADGNVSASAGTHGSLRHDPSLSGDLRGSTQWSSLLGQLCAFSATDCAGIVRWIVRKERFSWRG